MSYVAKHAAARKPNRTARFIGACAVAGVASIGGLSAQSAAAAPAAGGGVWDRVAACESGGDWSINTGNGYYGGLQFSASSWRAAGGTKYASMPHKASKGQQIAAAQNLLRLQGPGAWPVCSRKAGLTKANGVAAGGGAAAAKATPKKAAAKAAPKKAAAKKVVRKAPAKKVVNRAPQAHFTREQNRDLHSWLGMKRHHFMTPSTVKALQRKAGAPADGIVGPVTVRAVERMTDAKQTGASHFTRATLNKLASHAGI